MCRPVGKIPPHVPAQPCPLENSSLICRPSPALWKNLLSSAGPGTGLGPGPGPCRPLLYTHIYISSRRGKKDTLKISHQQNVYETFDGYLQTGNGIYFLNCNTICKMGAIYLLIFAQILIFQMVTTFGMIIEFF